MSRAVMRPLAMPRALRPTTGLSALAVAIALALAGCGGEASPSFSASVESHAGARAAAFADPAVPLEACAYDGSPLGFAETPRVNGVGTDGERLVREVMRYTGLPQNFDVVPHRDVPNAAALIVVDDTGTPRRVIAYNPAFMAQVARSTGDHNWAPVSVMAHEIGHHLSGHTIRRGGSQPPIELEADQFSGFVVHKMGGSLADAQRALRTLVPVEGSPTHPGRHQRLAAVERGWLEACRQLRDDCDGGAPDRSARRPSLVAAVDVAEAPTPASAPPMPPARRAAPEAMPGSVAPEDATGRAPRVGDEAPREPDATTSVPTVRPEAPKPVPGGSPIVESRPVVDRLPVPDPAATPIKTTQFVWDELGLLDPATRAAHEHAMYVHAERHGVEIVTLVVADLHGLEANAYAQAMARQLRVGKLDVGNGAVLVVAPRERKATAFLGPGLALEMQGHDKAAQLARWVEWNADGCLRRGACGAAETELLFGAADHLARQSAPLDWQVRYARFADVHAAAVAESRAIESYDPATSAVFRKLARFEATVVALDPAPDDPEVLVHDAELSGGRRALRVDYGDGFRGVVYIDRATEALMPAGPLEAGRRYAMTGRVDALSPNRRDTQSFDVVSWVLAE